MNTIQPSSLFPTFRRWLSSFTTVWSGYGSSIGSSFGPRLSWRMRPWWLYEGSEALHASFASLLATIHNERLEPAPVVAAFAEEHRGAYRRRLLRLSRRLQKGMPLIDALEQTPGVLGNHQVLAMRIATQNGTLESSLAEMVVAGSSSPAQQTRALLGKAFAYLVSMLLAISLIAAFLNTFIGPTFLAMSEEFGSTEPPALATQGQGFRSLPIVLLAVALGIIAFPLLRRMLGWSPLRLSWLNRIRRSQRHAEVDAILSKTLTAGRPLSGTISSLARYHDDPQIRRQLLLARNENELGVPIWESLQGAQIIPADLASTLSEIESSSMQAWILEKHANQKKSSLQRRTYLLASLLQPIFVLFCGFIVLWIVTAYFEFLTSLIHGLKE